MKNEKNPDRNGVPPPFPAGENLSPGLTGNPLPGVPGRGTAFPARDALKRAPPLLPERRRRSARHH